MDGKEFHGARSLVASTIWSRDNPFFSAHQVMNNRSQHNSSNIELCGIMLVSKDMTRVIFSTWTPSSFIFLASK